MVDRILLGKNEAGNEGLWVSKPGVDVTTVAGNTYLQALGDWYGYQEEFHGDGTDGEFVDTDSESGFHIWNGNGTGINGEKLKRTKNGTLIYTGADGGSGRVLYSKSNVDPANPLAPGPGSFIGSDYPIVEMRIRMLYDPGLQEGSGLNLYFYNNVIGATSTADNIWPGKSGTGGGNLTIHSGNYKNVFFDGETPLLNVWKILEWDMSNIAGWMDPYAFHGSSGPYSSQYRITRLRFDINGFGVVGAAWNKEEDPMWEIDYVRVKKPEIPKNAGATGDYRESLIFNSDINHMGLVHQTGIVTVGTAKAYIDGTTSDRVAGHNIDNDANGYVSFPELDYIPLVLFQRIDENVGVTGASYPGGEDEFSICTQNWEDHRYPTIDLGHSDGTNKGFDIQTVAEPITAASYLSFTVTQHLSEFANFDRSGLGNPLGAFRSNGPIYWQHHNNYFTTTWGPSYGTTVWDGTDPRFGNFYNPEAPFGNVNAPQNVNALFPNLDPDEWFNFGIGAANMVADSNIGSYMLHTGLGQPADYSDYDPWTAGSLVNNWKPGAGIGAYDDTIQWSEFPSNHALPWTGTIPAQSRRAGKKFSDMVESFSEVRTFAYARAKKDGFWLTCRNAIAQEGMEPALNLAPVLPEEGTANQGYIAFTNMASNNDNGAWGMFHPALALYDVGDGSGPQKFTEGLQLTWDTRTTANSILLDKIGTDNFNNTYPQYQWRPEFSCSGLPFNGTLARPNDPAPTDKTKFPLSYENSLASTPENRPTMPNARYTANGILKGDTGGFYPYRYQMNEHYHAEMEGADTEEGTLPIVAIEQKWWYGFQYNIKRLSSPGIFHPHGVVPTTDQEAFTNKNVPAAGNEIKNQTSYIGGAMNTKTAGPVASYDKTKTHAPRYKYWVLRIPVSIPEYT